MEFVTSISKPGKLWNLSGGHAKLWKSNGFGKKIYVTIENKNEVSETGMHACIIMLENMLHIHVHVYTYM